MGKKARKKPDKLDPKSRKWLLDKGYSIIDKAESYNAIIKRKHDLFNFIDMVAIHLVKGELLAIQITSKANLSTRIKKAEGLPAYWGWLRTGNPVEFHGWYKGDKDRWVVKIVRSEKPEWMG